MKPATGTSGDVWRECSADVARRRGWFGRLLADPLGRELVAVVALCLFQASLVVLLAWLL